MVTFNKKARTFTLTLSGDENDYMEYCKSLAHIIAMCDPCMPSPETIRSVADLLQDMLPDAQQIKTE